MDTALVPAPLVAEAAAWRLAARLLERPAPGWREAVAELASEVDDPALRAAAAAARCAVEGHYLALLGPGGPASPREAAYVGLGDPGHTLAELRAFYDAFAYRPRAEDPPDHVAVEAGFVSYLRLKEAFALGEGNEEAAATVREARGRFEREHLGRIAGPLAIRLAEHAPDTPWFAAVAWMGSGLDAGHVESSLNVLPDADPDAEGCFACGGDGTD